MRLELRSANPLATRPRRVSSGLLPEFIGDRVGSRARPPSTIYAARADVEFWPKAAALKTPQGALDTLSCHGGGSIQMAKTGSGGADRALGRAAGPTGRE